MDTAQDLPKLWEQRIAAQLESSLTIKAWCEKHGLSRHQYFYWRKRLEAMPADGDRGPLAWVPFDTFNKQELSIPNQCIITVKVGPAIIELHRGFDPELLREIVSALQPL